MTKRRYSAIVIAVAVGLILVGWLLYKVPGSGFGEYTGSVDAENRAKTLWDWMGVIVLPLALGGAALWFNRLGKNREAELLRQRYLLDQKLALELQRENALQAYLDRMTELLLKENLRASDEDAEVRDAARSRTLTVLRGLDSGRKGMLVQFLKEARLIERENAIVDLANADLSGATLNGLLLNRVFLCEANLEDADLSEAILKGAVLYRANLGGAKLQADLSEADLRESLLYKADLRWADLHKTDLSGASLMDADLLYAKYDKETRWPERFNPEAAGAVRVGDRPYRPPRPRR